MSQESRVLHKIARGAGIVFLGTVISMFFGFISRMIIVRYFTVSEFGLYSLTLTVINIVLVLVSLGFYDGVSREIAFYKEKEPSKVNEIASTSIFIIFLSSITFFILTFFGSDAIAQLLNQEELSTFIKIMAFVIPFSAMNGLIISFSRGFGRVKEQVYFGNIFSPILWLIFITLLAVLSLPFMSVFYAYLLVQILLSLVLFFYIYRLNLFEIKFPPNFKLGKELISFSLPLLITSILGFIMNWTDTLMLGYYKSAALVGLYNAAAPLARLISIFLGSIGFLYIPIASQLYAKGKIKEMGRNYQILTKWIFLLTLPIFSIMFLFPEAVISFIYGSKYVAASQVLRILASTAMFHIFLGLNGMSLVILKESKFIVFASLISAILNVVLNIMLIPPYGIFGAAIASLGAYVIGNSLSSLRLYQTTGIHPFSLNYVKPLAISFVLLGTIQILDLKIFNIWYVVPILAVFLLVYFFLVLLSKSVDKEDIELFLVVEKKLGVDLKIIKKILKRFV